MYRVSADIRYLTGSLAGITVPAGYNVTMPTFNSAYRVAGFLEKVRATNDFIRAVGTGNRYQVASNITMENLQ